MSTESDQENDHQQRAGQDTTSSPNEVSDDVDDGPNESSTPARRFGGALLRFFGMSLIFIALVRFAIFSDFLFSAITGSRGGAMHYWGRKIAPNSTGASVGGAVFGVVATIGVVIVGIIIMVVMFGAVVCAVDSGFAWCS
jgi:hypothetical protein